MSRSRRTVSSTTKRSSNSKPRGDAGSVAQKTQRIRRSWATHQVDGIQLEHARNAALALTRAVRNALWNVTIHTAPRIKDPIQLDNLVRRMCQRLGRLRNELAQSLSDNVETSLECALARRGQSQPISRWGHTSTTWHAASESLADSFVKLLLVSGSLIPSWMYTELLVGPVEPRRELTPNELQEYYRRVGQEKRRFDFPGEDVEASIRQEHADLTAEPVWLTVTEAAMKLMEVWDGLKLKHAKSRVSRAATRRFRTNGEKRSKRRIDADSFSAWLLKQRERSLDRDNHD